MPKIVTEITTMKDFAKNLTIHLRRAEIPAYSWKEQRAGFEVWHAEQREGETMLIWHSFLDTENEATTEQRAGLERCAKVLQKYYWVKLDMPSNYTDANRPTLRVLFGLNWLK